MASTEYVVTCLVLEQNNEGRLRGAGLSPVHVCAVSSDDTPGERQYSSEVQGHLVRLL